MAKPLNDGTLSGAIGNIVFVSKGAYTYARSKPANIKQTASTKAAASAFGWVSQQDKKFGFALTQAYTVITDNYYAARHRARMAKALNPSLGASGSPASLLLTCHRHWKGLSLTAMCRGLRPAIFIWRLPKATATPWNASSLP